MTEQTKIFVWRNRRRGFLIVAAKNLSEARDIVAADHNTWWHYAQAHEPERMLARVGEGMYIPQRNA